jgi:hypothetical protein
MVGCGNPYEAAHGFNEKQDEELLAEFYKLAYDDHPERDNDPRPDEVKMVSAFARLRERFLTCRHCGSLWPLPREEKEEQKTLWKKLDHIIELLEQRPLVDLGGQMVIEGSGPDVRKAEIEWRCQEALEGYLRQREAWFRATKGTLPPGVTPSLNDHLRKVITDALKRHPHYLGPEERDAWKANSLVYAAGKGIWTSEFHTEKGYTQPERCWQILKGEDQCAKWGNRFHEAIHERRRG